MTPDDTPRAVTIVNGADGKERVEANVVLVDDAWVVVEVEGAERRFSRRTGFEHPQGGSWSKWRLSGTDHRRLQKEKEPT